MRTAFDDGSGDSCADADSDEARLHPAIGDARDDECSRRCESVWCRFVLCGRYGNGNDADVFDRRADSHGHHAVALD